MMLEILLGIIIVLLFVVILLLLKKEKVGLREIESVLFKVWKESGIDEKVGELAVHTREIKESHKSIEEMLRVPTEKGAFGEIALETILLDHLPTDMLGIKEKVLDGKIPDAFVKSTVGIICIDSKFPLDNYRNDDRKVKIRGKKKITRNNFSKI